MKRVAYSIAGLVAGTLAVPVAMAQPKPPADVAAKMQACFACHVVEGKKTIGPTYKEVAAKYAGQKDIDKTLAASVIKGSDPSKLKWGQVPMPPNAGITEAEALKMVQWVLTLK